MFKIIVCDDIPVIRDNIATLLKSSHPEWQIISDYYDGEQVIAHLKREPVHLIVSDIKMQNASGIDILKYIDESGINTRVIVITAYSDFKYAKDAVNYHAAKFLVKPLNPNNLLKIVEEEYERFRMEEAAKASQLDMVNQLLMRSKMHRMLEQLYSKPNSFSTFVDYCEANNPNYLTKAFYYIRMRSKDDSDTVNHSIMYDAVELHNIDINSFMVFQSEHEYILFAFVNDSKEAAEQFYTYITQIGKNDFVSVYPFENISRLYGKNRDIAMEYIICMECNDYGRRQTIESYVREELPLSKEILFLRKIREHYKEYKFTNCNDNIVTKEDANAVFSSMSGELEQLLSDNYKQLRLEKVKHYLEQNFGDPMLSLESVSRRFNFSSTYMSKQFSDYYGVSFTETLTTLRMEHAKKLLLSPNISIRDVATACGYNEKYFSKLFTKKIGVNPRTYRDRREL